MSLTDLKKELKKLDKDKLIGLLTDLYKKDKSVREFLDFYVNPNERALFEKYRDKVYEAFYPKRGYSLKLREGKLAISEFKKHGPSADLIADLMLFYVETGVTFTKEFGDIDEGFYSSLESTYLAALKFIRKENLLHKFAKRAAQVVRGTSGIGWGFHDSLEYTYFDFFSSDDVEQFDKK